MTDTWTRLGWALPSVLLLGVALMLALRRVLGQAKPSTSQARLVLVESLRINEDIAIHLLSTDGKPALLVETRNQPSDLSFVPQPPRPGPTTRFGWKAQ